MLGVVRPGAAAAALATRNRRVGVIATPATVRSHAYFNAIKDENPAVEVYEHATPRFVPMVEAGILTGPELEAAVAEELAPLLGERDGGGRVRVPAPAVARRSTRCSWAAPTTRCCGRCWPRAVGDRVAIVDSATATAVVAGRAAVGQRARGAGDDPGHRRGRRRRRPLATRARRYGRRRPATSSSRPATSSRFRSIAARMFGESFPDVGAGRAGAARSGR